MSKETDLSSSYDISQGISGVNISDNGSICGSCTDNSTEICANCGKGGALNTCNKCKQVKYCNAVCKKVHKKKHKKDCEEYVRRVAELHEEESRRAAELRDIELFKQPPPPEEECPICFQRLPLLGSGKKYKSCCGKYVCNGCSYAHSNIDPIKQLCPFCGIPAAKSNEENIKRLKKRVEVNDGEAIHNLGSYYSQGIYNLPQDHAKALKLWYQAAELGSAPAYFSIGTAYQLKQGVKSDMKKAMHYYELAAMKGDDGARYMLGYAEQNRGNVERAIKHYLIAVVYGHHDSLTVIQELYSNGHATKDDYTKALRAYQEYLNEVKSPQRDEAAAYKDEYKYIE